MKNYRNKDNHLGIFLVILFFSILLIVGGVKISNNINREVASSGVVDFEELNHHGIIELNGQWEFYWNQLLTPSDLNNDENKRRIEYINQPGIWTNIKGKNYPAEGHATLRIRLKNTSLSKNRAFYMPTINSNYKLWINEELIYENGIVSDKPEQSKVLRCEKFIHFYDDSEWLDITMQISNYRSIFKGGSNGSIYFGEHEDIQKFVFKETIMIIFTVGALFIMAFYHFGLFALRKKDISVMYFGLMCLFAAIRAILIDSFILDIFVPNVDWVLKAKMQCIVAELGIYMMLLFLDGIFRKCRVKKIFYGINFIVVTSIVAHIFMNIYAIGATVYTNNIVTGMVVLYSIFIIAVAVSKKEEGSVLLTIGIGVAIIIAVNDILHNLHIIYTGYYVSFTIIFVVFVQSIILSKKSANAFKTAEALSERLVSVDKLKDEFLANTTHELRTPLNGIVGMSEAILHDGENLKEEQKENISLIISSGNRLNKLINDILDFSKLRNKDLILEQRNVDLKQLVNVVIAISENTFEGKEIKIINELPDDLPYIWVDENRVEQILYNILGNAIKNTHDGKIIISAKDRGNKLEVSIEDTGVGIPEEKLKSIFNPFEQVNDNNNRNKGLGLGLSITKKFIELHGGVIKAESKLGKGSKFIFTLPISRNINESEIEVRYDKKNIKKEIESKTPKEKNTTENSKYDSSKYRILVVDDEAINRKVLIKNLRPRGYQVVTAVDGVDAIKKIRKYRNFDLVILDVMMPKMSGYDVCREIRKEYSLIELPVILMTALEKNQVIKLGFDVGANDYVFKPIEKTEVMARVDTLLKLKKSAESVVTSELCFLQAQIKPHFLFNALNTIMSFCRTNPEKARELLLNLSNYLRKSFDFNNKKKFVTIENEVEFIKSYLAIEKARFSKRLNVVYDIDDAINCKLPPLILQPLVENSVRHGIAPKRKGGTVTISIWEEISDVCIEIKDDGVGMDSEKLDAIKSGNLEGGVGLKNIMKRLHLLYGYNLDIKSVEGEGTTYFLKVPLNEEDRDND